MVKNLSWKNKQTNLREIDGFEQNIAQSAPIRNQQDRRRTRSRTYERQNHARTNVRREHQARTHVRTSKESTKRTVHIQQWGSFPLSLAGWQGLARRN